VGRDGLRARVRWQPGREQWFISRQEANGWWVFYDFAYADWPTHPRPAGQLYTPDRHQADAVAEAFNALLALET
jgi:hypothetical protein